jgi:hypothetical protein
MRVGSADPSGALARRVRHEKLVERTSWLKFRVFVMANTARK